MSLRPKLVPLRLDETPLRVLQVDLCCWTIKFGLVGGSASAGLVHDINRLALSQEELRPTFTSIRRSREVSSRLASAVNHYDRPGVRELGRDLELGIKLAAHRLPVADVGVFSAREEVAFPRDRQRLGSLRLCSQPPWRQAESED